MHRRNLTSLVALAASVSAGIMGVLSAPLRFDGADKTLFRRACADPGLALPIYNGYLERSAVHSLNFLYLFVHGNTVEGPVTTPPRWIIEGPATFRAWPDQQAGVPLLPLYHLIAPDGVDVVYRLGTVDPKTGTPSPPTVSGFSADVAITAWIYGTPVCGAVALLGADFAAASDHYYTTEENDHAGLIREGWTDDGVVGYVLPASTY